MATIGILQERAIRRGEVLNEQLQTALTSRVVVEQAKGVLAQHHGLSMDAAFDRLRRYARDHNLRLAEVARQLATGKLDPATIHTSPDRLPTLKAWCCRRYRAPTWPGTRADVFAYIGATGAAFGLPVRPGLFSSGPASRDERPMGQRLCRAEQHPDIGQRTARSSVPAG